MLCLGGWSGLFLSSCFLFTQWHVLLLLHVQGVVSFKPAPLALTGAALKLDGKFLGNRIGTAMTFLPEQGQFALEARADRISLQDTVKALGIPLNLGSLDMYMENVLIQMPHFDFGSSAAGMRVMGSFSWLVWPRVKIHADVLYRFVYLLRSSLDLFVAALHTCLQHKCLTLAYHRHQLCTIC